MSTSTPTDQAETNARASTAQTDRRDWVRFPSDLEAICWAPGHLDQDAFGGIVRDISAGGIGLVSWEQQPLGCQIRIKLHSHYVSLLKSPDASVVCVTSVGRGEFLIGCQFDRALNQDERRHML
jgi:hypothetical protein